MSITENNEVAPLGRQFQNDVAGLFQIAGYQVHQDILVGHKKVDILVSEWRFGKQDNIAVECKDWNKTLTLKDVNEIFSDYRTLADKALITEILLVTKRGIADAAKAMVLESSKFRHSTYLELQASIMDFRSYLNGLVGQYQEDGLDQYYVPPRATLYRNSPDIPPNLDRERLFEALPNPPPMAEDRDEKKPGSTQVYYDLDVIIDTWLSLKTVRTLPVAILGSYGLGKTTFARHIA